MQATHPRLVVGLTFPILHLQRKTLPLFDKVIILDALTYVTLKFVQNENIAIALDIQLISVGRCIANSSFTEYWPGMYY